MTARVLAAAWVPGVPRTQGSMEHVGGGKMKHSDALVRWRSLVSAEIRRHGYAIRLDSSRQPHCVDKWPYVGPVAVRCIFVRGDGVGDIDKLARAVLDALTESRVIADDVQVVELRCSRVGREGPRGNGAFVLVATVDDSVEAEYERFAEIDGWVPR